MTVKKFNYVKFSIFIVIVITIITLITIGIVSLVKHIKYTKTNEYKLVQIGYSLDETAIIERKLNTNQINKLLTEKYDSELANYANEKYFIYSNYEKYLEYKKKNKSLDYSKVISIINTEANIDWFDNERETDTSKNELMLVNRIYGLNKDYVPDDIASVPTKYAYSGKKLRQITIDAIMLLCDEASENGYTFVVSDGYRTYKEQEKLYNNYAKYNGKSETDKVVARPGHSEYETGLSFNLVPYNKVSKTPKLSEEYLWLKDNAYKYGFIFRFEAENENLTGFREDVWRLRYVGEEAATTMYYEKICFEEYYAYYVEGDKNE